MPKERKLPSDAQQRLRSLLHQAKQPIEMKRIQSVYFLVKYNHSPEEVADMVGYHPNYVRRLFASYLKEGEKVFSAQKRGGRHRQNLSFEQEQQLLLKFKTQAVKGQILQVGQIKKAYQQAVGKPVPKSTIYRMLSRHGWRKLIPRPSHPKNNPNHIEEFKKNSLTWLVMPKNKQGRKAKTFE